MRGLTVYFGPQPPLEKLAREEELIDLREAYETIAQRGDGPTLSTWCRSPEARTKANDVRERLRGLLLLFERLADRGLSPFTDGRVRFISADTKPLDWSVLPPALVRFKPWLEKFGDLSEYELYEYARLANEKQLRELAALKALMDREGQLLLEWCEENTVEGNPVGDEAFQAEWLFVLMDFAKSRIEVVIDP